jgi:5-methyltetrahydropteroyltriglutamate--homocysteine methyltransferase
MKRSTQEILTTHSGSLPRPPKLRALVHDLAAGERVDPAVFDAEARAAVSEIVAHQLAAGVHVVNDGEVSKHSFSGYIEDRLTGFETREAKPGDSIGDRGVREREQFAEFYGKRPDAFYAKDRAPVRMVSCCVGPIEWRNFDAVERDIDNLAAAIADRDVEDAFMSAISPGDTLRKHPNRYYVSEVEYMQAVGDAMRREYAAIIDAGFILQIDCPDLTTGAHPDHFSKDAFLAEITANVEALNYATRDLPPDRMRIHVCWGSMERPHSLDPEISDLVDILLKARPDGMTIVAANGRHAFEWQSWKHVDLPPGKVVIPGVIDSTTNIIETPQVVARRILRFAEVLGPENLIAGVDCGFQTSVDRDQVTPNIAWAKLRALSDGARLATRELWHA